MLLSWEVKSRLFKAHILNLKGMKKQDQWHWSMPVMVVWGLGGQSPFT